MKTFKDIFLQILCIYYFLKWLFIFYVCMIVDKSKNTLILYIFHCITLPVKQIILTAFLTTTKLWRWELISVRERLRRPLKTYIHTYIMYIRTYIRSRMQRCQVYIWTLSLLEVLRMHGEAVLTSYIYFLLVAGT